jgi:hypothetical protein
MGDVADHSVLEKDHDFSFLQDESLMAAEHPTDVTGLDTTLSNISSINDVSVSGQKRKGTPPQLPPSPLQMHRSTTNVPRFGLVAVCSQDGPVSIHGESPLLQRYHPRGNAVTGARARRGRGLGCRNCTDDDFFFVEEDEGSQQASCIAYGVVLFARGACQGKCSGWAHHDGTRVLTHDYERQHKFVVHCKDIVVFFLFLLVHEGAAEQLEEGERCLGALSDEEAARYHRIGREQVENDQTWHHHDLTFVHVEAHALRQCYHKRHHHH